MLEIRGLVVLALLVDTVVAAVDLNDDDDLVGSSALVFDDVVAGVAVDNVDDILDDLAVAAALVAVDCLSAAVADNNEE